MRVTLKFRQCVTSDRPIISISTSALQGKAAQPRDADGVKASRKEQDDADIVYPRRLRCAILTCILQCDGLLIHVVLILILFLIISNSLPQRLQFFLVLADFSLKVRKYHKQVVQLALDRFLFLLFLR